MRLTQCLRATNIYRQTKRHWYNSNKKIIRRWGYGDKILEAKGIQVKDAAATVFSQADRMPYDFSTFAESILLPLKKDIPTRPKTIYTSSDNDLLVLGVPQAQVITKTLLVKQGFPDKILSLIEDCPPEIDHLARRIVKNSAIFNAHQEKLPRRIDPDRPWWIFKRDYGITSIRRIRDMSNKFVRLCDLVAGPDVANSRRIVHDATMSLPFEKDLDGYQFKYTMDLMVTASSPLGPICDQHLYKNAKMPNLHPIHHTVSLVQDNAYELENIYPIDPKSKFQDMHMVFTHNDPRTVVNLTELPVKETQIHGRSLMKAFTAAACRARQKYGMDVKTLPEPITVQTIQSDGQTFHFAVLQLNTLDLDDGEGDVNYWWSIPNMRLFEFAGYHRGMPVVNGYNPEVFKTILAFYKNT